jgi:hypothetical protein
VKYDKIGQGGKLGQCFTPDAVADLVAAVHIGDMLKMRDGQWMSDVVVMNPPFSDRKETGSKTSNNGFWKFVRKAKQHVAPGGCLIFIAPQTWESALAKEDRDGTYEVIEADADFGDKHPNAAVVKWTAGTYAVKGGRDDRKPEMPTFNVEVLSSDRAKRVATCWGVTEFGKLTQPGELVSPRATLVEGSDSEACARWIVEHRDGIIAWWGAPANGHGKVRISAIKELLK